MNRLRHLSALLLVVAFATFQLLASAPLFHSAHCESLETLAQAKHQREAPAFRPLGETLPEGSDDCPVCMVSGLAAILSPGLAVLTPTADQAALLLPPGVALRAAATGALRSRAPPAP
jgi:hypothetical protein